MKMICRTDGRAVTMLAAGQGASLHGCIRDVNLNLRLITTRALDPSTSTGAYVLLAQLVVLLVGVRQGGGG